MSGKKSFYCGPVDSAFAKYTLISPLGGKNPLKLNDYIDDGEADELILDHVLEYCPAENIYNYLTLAAKKLAKGGTLTIMGTDLVILSEAFIRGEVNIVDFNKVLFGTKQHPWDFKLSAICLSDVNDILKSFGLKLLERKLSGHEFTIKVERP
jgi:hypothetical protein